jgi:hypothetical protein
MLAVKRSFQYCCDPKDGGALEGITVAIAIWDVVASELFCD